MLVLVMRALAARNILRQIGGVPVWLIHKLDMCVAC